MFDLLSWRQDNLLTGCAGLNEVAMWSFRIGEVVKNLIHMTSRYISATRVRIVEDCSLEFRTGKRGLRLLGNEEIVGQAVGGLASRRDTDLNIEVSIGRQ